MAYKLLGVIVWKGARWFLNRRYGHLLPSRRVGSAVVVGLAIAGLIAAGARRDPSGA